jgi:hypothetical protein
MKKKKVEPKKVTMEFDEAHLPTLVSALEVYSRLRSGQISIAMDTAFWDVNLSWDERQFIENAVRYIVFPSQPKREYDGHGEFYDQYNNEYDSGGSLVKESEEWEQKKNRPHLDYPNSYFGVGCDEMKDGTVAWEIKKTIDQYLHYQRNNGFRRICDVSGDGAMQISKVPVPKVLNFDPCKTIKIPKRYYNKIEKNFENKEWSVLWNLTDKIFAKNPLPKGKSTTIKKIEDDWCVVVNEPYEQN